MEPFASHNGKTLATVVAPAVEEISGTVTQLFFQKVSFCAGEMRSKGRNIKFSVKGFVKPGEPVTLRGQYKTHPKFGRQFEGTEVVYTLPADPDGLATWLSWYVSDVGPKKGQKLVDEFGMDLTRLAAEDPQQVAACAGIPIESIHRIADEWQKFSAKIAAFSELASFGLTQHQVEVLYARFKASAVTILREDPYLLLREVDGFGFKTVDEIARKLGFPEDHPGRKRAAYVTAVADAKDADGSTAVLDTVAIGRACDMLDMPHEEYAPAVEAMAIHADQIQQVRRVSDGKVWYVGLPASYRHEELIWGRLSRGSEQNPHFDFLTPEDVSEAGRAPGYEPSIDMVRRNYAKLGDKELDDTQVRAVATAISSRVSFVTGGAGAGKTLVARAIAKFFTDGDVRVMLAAPTGKAARRLTEVVGVEASTIHRLLEFRGDGRFFHDDLNPLPDGVLLVDEASMVPCSLGYHLLRAVGPRTAVVFIGDPNQLPPVEAGALLRDVLDHDLAPVARLEKCHRQAGPLKANCSAILDGRVEPSVMEPTPAPWMVHNALTTVEQVQRAVVTLFEKYLPEWGYDPVNDTQFLTAQHKGPLGTRFLNRVCQQLRQKRLGVVLDKPAPEDEMKPTLYPGDKVIHTRNNYTLGVMNGTQGVVIEAGGSLVVRYDGKDVTYTTESKDEIELAYVITPHKAQGSEWPCVVTICHKQHKFMQTRAWLYTSVTRAQRTAVIIGDEDGIRRAAENNRRDNRGTWLSVFARHPETRP